LGVHLGSPITLLVIDPEFRSPVGSLLLVEQLEVGSQVLSVDGNTLSVVSRCPHILDKYSIVELVTRKGSFKVSACHRIAVGAENGATTEVRSAGGLRRGDYVFIGTRLLPLTKVCIFETRTEL
jgi:hypothetical protein